MTINCSLVTFTVLIQGYENILKFILVIFTKGKVTEMAFSLFILFAVLYPIVEKPKVLMKVCDKTPSGYVRPLACFVNPCSRRHRTVKNIICATWFM